MEIGRFATPIKKTICEKQLICSCSISCLLAPQRLLCTTQTIPSVNTGYLLHQYQTMYRIYMYLSVTMSSIALVVQTFLFCSQVTNSNTVHSSLVTPRLIYEQTTHKYIFLFCLYPLASAALAPAHVIHASLVSLRSPSLSNYPILPLIPRHSHFLSLLLAQSIH